MKIVSSIIELPAGAIDSPDPLPPLALPSRKPPKTILHESVPARDSAFFVENDTWSCMPYSRQNSFDRTIKPRKFAAITLENDKLRAIFLPGLGGRLWSLFHKPSNRELLYQPPNLEFANVGISNAWFSGGIEWNIAVAGHSPLTTRPVFAAIVQDGDESCLRIYERDRFRGLFYQIDFLLPEGSDFLLARPTVINDSNLTVPMYWWSNIAVPLREKTRVIGPVSNAYYFGYQQMVRMAPIPICDNVDVSYPRNLRWASDYYYNVPADNRPWISSVDENGDGLMYASTSRLMGRKYFGWGMSPGALNWQDRLGGCGTQYIEIQGGLTKTQDGYIPIPANTRWDWIEAFGPLSAGVSVAHHKKWDESWRQIQTSLDIQLPQTRMDDILETTRELAVKSPTRIIHAGSGWGALEQERRNRVENSRPMPQGMVFPAETIGPEQMPWMDLLQTGHMPEPSCGLPPSWMVEAQWREILTQATRSGTADNWIAWLHMGNMAWQAGDIDLADENWRKSISKKPSAIALRNRGIYLRETGKSAQAVDLYLQAWKLAPLIITLAEELACLLMAEGRQNELIAWYGTLDKSVQSSGRIMAAVAEAFLSIGKIQSARQIIHDLQILDLKEGEAIMTDIWAKLVRLENKELAGASLEEIDRKFPPPARLEYRVKPD